MQIFFFVLIFSIPAYARWATEEDLSYKTLSTERLINVKSDGTYVMTDTVTYEILKDSAKEKFSLYKLPYRSHTSTLKILEAKVTNGINAINVPLDKVVDRSIASDIAIDDSKEVQIPLPQIQVKSRISLKYQTTIKKIVVLNHFSTSFFIGLDGMEEASLIRFVSEIPLHFDKHDPFDALEVVEEKIDKKHLLTFKLKTPFLHQLAEEGGILPSNKLTFVQLSSDKNWESIGSSLQSRFDPVVGSPLPKELDSILEEAKTLTTLNDKVNFLVAYMTQNYNYVGDWRTLRGAFSPRPLAEIVSTKYGDCKDFSTLLTAMLRKISVDAHVALVSRNPSGYNRFYLSTLPSPNMFNHAIVRVKEAENSYWIDPTNKTSFGLSHRDDIADRASMVLNGQFQLSHIPKIFAEQNVLELDKDISFENLSNAQVSTKLSLSGLFGLVFTGTEQTEPKAKIHQALLGLMSQGETSTLPEVSNFDFKTKKYSKTNVNAKYSSSDFFKEHNGKKYLLLPDFRGFVATFFSNLNQWEGDVPLGENFAIERRFVMKGLFVNERINGCKLDTKWATIKREFEYTNEGLRIADSVRYKANFIDRNDFKSTELELFQHDLGKCTADTAIEVKEGAKKHIAGLEEIEATFSKFKGNEKLTKRIEYVLAVTDKKIEGLGSFDRWKLLRKNIAENKNHSESYLILARDVLSDGYFNGDNYSPQSISEAKVIVQEGLSVAPKNISLSLLNLRLAKLSGDIKKVETELPGVLTTGEINNAGDVICLSTLYEALGRPNEGIAAMKGVLAKSKSNDDKENLNFKIASASARNNQLQESMNHYYAVLKLNPKHAFTLNNLPGILVGLSKFDEAITVALEGVKLNKSGMMQKVASEALLSRAQEHFKKKNFELAEQDLRHSIQIRKNSAAYLNLARIKSSQGDFHRSIELINEGATATEQNLYDYYKSASMNFMPMSLPYLECMKKAFLSSTDMNTKLWAGFELGMTYKHLKMTSELISVLTQTVAVGEELIKTHPNDYAYLSSLGGSLSMLGIAQGNHETLKRAIVYLEKSEPVAPVGRSNKHQIAEAREVLESLSKTARMPASK